jgi:O-antigen ligase
LHLIRSKDKSGFGFTHGVVAAALFGIQAAINFTWMDTMMLSTVTGASTTTATGTEDIRTSNLPLIVGVSVGVAVLIAAAVILTVALVSLRRRRGNLGGEGMGPSYIPMRSK